MNTDKRLSLFIAGAAALALSLGSATADDDVRAAVSAFGEPVNAAELESQRGKALPECASGCTLGNMTAILTGNTATAGAVTGTNVIGDGTLANSAGAFIAVQNVGNNVIIQTQMDVNVNLVQQ